MFKGTLFCSLLALIISTSSPAFAESVYPYIGVTGGVPLSSVTKLSDSTGSLTTDFNSGYMAGLSAGAIIYTWGGWNIERVRTEAEIGYRSNELTSVKNVQGQSTNVNGRVSVANIMVNGYLENSSMLPGDLPVNIFLTAGAGAAIASISSVYHQGTKLINSASNTQFAYQGGLGAGYDLTKNITIDVTYKYLGTTTFKFAGINADYGSHNILLGVQYIFR